MKKILLFLLIIIIPFKVSAEEITSSSTLEINGKSIDKKLIDNNEKTSVSISSNDEIKIKNSEYIKGIYIEYYKYNDFTAILSSNNKNILIGEEGFLHQYVDVKKLLGDTLELSIKYNNDVEICEIYIIGEGELPEFVEVWEEPVKKADIMLFSTHSDDEHLFFLGILPTYIARDAKIEVVYLVSHDDKPIRLHEQLHGLYTVGLRNYPVIGFVPDAYSETKEDAIKKLEKSKYSVDDIKKFQVTNIRKFKPSVVIGHDEEGEYHHGQHILNTFVLKDSIIDAFNEEYDLESIKKYGVHQISKLYLHSYKLNEIIMDYDTPLEYYNGLTAYQVSKEGYKKHNSQQWDGFVKWLNGKNNQYTKATDIKKYSPCNFGLYYTNVGEDILKNDFMENIKYIKEEVKEENQSETQKETIITEKVKEGNNIIIYVSIGMSFLLILLIGLLIILFKRK